MFLCFSVMKGAEMESLKEISTRILDYMHTGHMYQVMDMEEELKSLIDFSDCDWKWNYNKLITGIFLYGYEEGIRAEREKRRACNG